jgi:predicted nucleotidyltransferase
VRLPAAGVSQRRRRPSHGRDPDLSSQRRALERRGYTAGVSPPTPRLVETVHAVLARWPQVELALLFGSRARRQSHPGSDLDLAIAGEQLDRLALIDELAAATGLEVDVVDLATAGYPLLRALLRESITVHQGDPHAAARFRTRAILLTESDRPSFERMRDAYLSRLASSQHG